MKNSSIAFEHIVELEQFILNSEFEDQSSLLIQVFCANTNVETIKELQYLINQKLPKAVLIGVTTDGVINSQELYVDSKNVATFSVFQSTKLQSKMIEYSEDKRSSYYAGVELAQTLAETGLKVILSFSDGLNTNGEDFVSGIESVLSDVVLAGGMAGDNGKFETTYIFDNQKITNSGVVGVGLINEDLYVATSYNFDWIPIGKKMRVTKVEQNRVYELDGIPIVDVYAKYMGHELASKLPQVGIEFPLIFEKRGISIGRAPIAKHNDGSLTFAGNIEQYEVVRFGVGDADSILNNGINSIRSFVEKYKYKAEALFIYSCMARRRFLDSYTKYELEAISKIGDSSGFFSYGEFFHFKTNNQLLNETMTFIAISEKSHYTKTIDRLDYNSVDKKSFVTTQHVLANLVNTVSNELAELNTNLEQRVRENSEYIFRQAYTSELTGLPNRISLINDLDENIGKVLVLLNIDDFTTINDFYGYQLGDKVLQHVAKVLQNYALKYNSKAYKLPSDEFAVILDVKTDRDSISKHLEQIIEAVESSEYFQNEHYIHIGITLGAALINAKRTGMINADMTLKLAKAEDKSFMIFDKDLKLAQKYEYNAKMANIVKKALSSDNIIPYFQPIYNTNTLEVVKYEVLARLRMEDGTILSPHAFLEISRKIKLYDRITKVMIEKTFSFFAQNGKKFSLNLSYVDIVNQHIKVFLFEQMQKYGIAKQLTIEILETQEFEDVHKVFEFVQDVYAHGAIVAIDDFGSGYANFEYMTIVPSDVMKIDGSLIKNIDTDQNARIITETIVGFGKKIGKRIVAEYVHSKEVYEVVKELGIDCVQGYYFSEPKEFIETL